MSEYNHLLKKIYINGKKRTFNNLDYKIENNTKNIQKQARLYSHELFKNLNLENQVTLDLFYDGFLKDKHYKVIIDFQAYNFAFLNDNILVFKNISGKKDNAKLFKQEILLNYGQYNWYTLRQSENKKKNDLLDLTKENSEDYFLKPHKNIYAYSGDYKKEETYTVTYKNHDNSTFQVQSVLKNSKIPFIPTPIKKGHNFEKWYILDKDNTKKEFKPTTPITKDIILVPKFNSISYLISYDTNNGILPKTSTFPTTYTVNDRLEIPKAQREGYEFAGWVDERTTIPNKEYTIEPGRTGYLELTAQWKAEEIDVEFDYNDDKKTLNKVEKFQYNHTYNLEIPIRKNYLFIGWKNIDTQEILNQTGIFTYKNKIKLQAQWQENTYNVKFYLGNDELLEDDIYQDINKQVHDYTLEKNAFIKEPLTPSKKGHVFLGWFLDKNTRVSFPYQSSIDTKIIAYWRINKYILNFFPNGGDWVINKYTVKNVDEFGPVSYQVKEDFGKIIQEAPSSKKHGYKFKGWYRFNPKDPTSPIEEKDKITFPYTIKDTDESFKALWEAKDLIINYDPNGGTMPEDHKELSEKVSFEKSFILPQPTKENYNFIGWVLKGQDKILTAYDLLFDQPNNLVAKWIPKKFIININTKSDSYIPDIEKDYNSTLELSKVQTPIKSGYKFSHWDIKSTKQTGSLKDQTSITILENITLIANYTKLNYTISFNVNEDKIGTNLDELKQQDNKEQFLKDKTISYTIEDTKNIPNLEFPGYDFLGWSFIENGLPIKDLQIKNRTGDIKLYAQWQNKQYTLNYGNEENEELDTVKVFYKEQFKLRTAFKQGHTFISWHTVKEPEQMNETNKFTDLVPWNYLQDQTIYPKFEINTYKVHFLVDGKPLQVDGKNYIQNVEYNKKINFAELNAHNPTKEGYSFIDWHIAEDIYDKNKTVTYELFLVAKFKPNTYTLTYYGYNEQGMYSTNKTLKVEYGKYFKIPSDLITHKDAFVLKSWHTTDQKDLQTE